MVGVVVLLPQNLIRRLFLSCSVVVLGLIPPHPVPFVCNRFALHTFFALLFSLGSPNFAGNIVNPHRVCGHGDPHALPSSSSSSSRDRHDEQYTEEHRRLEESGESSHEMKRASASVLYLHVSFPRETQSMHFVHIPLP